MPRVAAEVAQATQLLAVPAYRRALLAHRVAASIEHEEQPFAEFYGTVIDVGSNRGQFAVFARHRWPKQTCSASSLCLVLARY